MIDFAGHMPYTGIMTYLVALFIFGLCVAAMAIGLIISRKRLIKGCSTDPDECACLREGKDPAKCDQ